MAIFEFLLEQKIEAELIEETITEKRAVRPNSAEQSVFNSEAHLFDPPPAYGEFAPVGMAEPPPTYSKHASPQEMSFGQVWGAIAAKPHEPEPPPFGSPHESHEMSNGQKAILAGGAVLGTAGLAGAGVLAYRHYVDSHENAGAHNGYQNYYYGHDASHM